MSNNTQEQAKKDHPIINGVAIGIILLFVTTLYNLVLAHIWPVTIHFGEYSLANAIYLMVSLLTTVVIAYLSFVFAVFYFTRGILRGFRYLMSTPEARAARKIPWYDRLFDGLALAFMLPFRLLNWWIEHGRWR